MKTHRWILHVTIPARTVTADGSSGALRTRPLIWAATRGILILAIVLGGLGAEAAASSGHSGDHAGPHRQVGEIRYATSSYAVGSGYIKNGPWMY
jgi:hypothetical protein